ncbi:hypothetical protein CspHIS471_0501250 [Cutaneotrichosporon sp. HIS471]|nr:hypothetical protein CspHIS471_0501250 [Cutaneotrichosporon sp. HIS471]
MHGPQHQAMNRRVSGGQVPQQANLKNLGVNPAAPSQPHSNASHPHGQPNSHPHPGHQSLSPTRLDLAALFPAAQIDSNNGPNPTEYYNARMLPGYQQGLPTQSGAQGGRGRRSEDSVAAALGMHTAAPTHSSNPPQLQMHRHSPGAMARSPSASGVVVEDDPVKPFLDGFAAAVNEPTQRAMWTELIKLKTKSLEHAIADARARERTAEVTLLKLQQGIRSINQNRQSLQVGGFQQGANYSNFPLVTHARSPAVEPQQGFPEAVPNVTMPPPQQPQQSQQPQPPPPQQQQQQQQVQQQLSQQQQAAQFSNELGPMTMSPFDLEAMLQGAGNNLDNLFAWLPDNGATDMPQTANPADLLVGGELMMPMGSSMTDGPTPITPASPPIKRPHTPESDESPAAPPAKKGKVRGEKKLVIEQHACCQQCGKTIARVLIRAPKSAIPSPISVEFWCPDCTGVHQPPTFDPHAAMGSGPAIGSTETRKRMRTAMEDDDMLNDDPSRRRCFCDVCQRVVCVGQVVGGPERQSLGNMTEIVCTSCDSKYQRCTDCGGGGGPRVGIGKWRLKQVFQVGRKTCSLSHNRLGDRPREIGVHVTPSDFTPEQLKEVVARCKTLWTEKTLSRLAVPEMLEIDLPPHITNPLRNYNDVENIVHRCWPSREAMIRAEGADPARFKRLLGLTWAHARSRRSVRTVDIEEQYAHDQQADDDNVSTVLANVKRTNAVIPPGSELIGMWGGEWDMDSGSLLVSTLIPFEGTDGEDHSALSVGELITKVQQLQQAMNEQRTTEAAATGCKTELVRPCEHLWVVSGGSMPLIRERMADILVRKRSFVHVEEYLTRHPDFVNALKARPAGLHPEQHEPLPHQVDKDHMYRGPGPLVLVRWLGKDYDAQKILEIKQMEFGGGKAKKLKKMPKSKA